MAEFLAIGFFCLALVVCLFLNWSVLVALLLGLVGFLIYGFYRGHSLSALTKMSLSGVNRALTVIVTMLLIGMLTASWRASGTIAYLVDYSIQLISPSYCLVSTFILNAALSSLIGTAFGTVATLGVVTMSLCTAVGIDPFFSGGAVLAGVFVGDRCSPVSTSALLVASVTKTDLYKNLRLMIKTGAVPMIISCLLYIFIGYQTQSGADVLPVTHLFGKEFLLSLWTLLPAVSLFILIGFKVDIRLTMILSTLTACLVAFFLQDRTLPEIGKYLISGYEAKDSALAVMLNGGGLISMVHVSAVLTVSCCYAGLFEGTGLLQGLTRFVQSIANRITKFGAITLTATATAMLCCNQALSVILTQQICHKIEPDNQKLAIDIENTSIVIAAIIPWSIACAVPLATVGASDSAICTAFFLYLLPLYSFIVRFKDR